MDLTEYAANVHLANAPWWHDIHTGRRIERNFGELIALCHSELSEALEGDRKSLADDKLPEYEMRDVELIDCMIRILDILGSRGRDVEAIFQAKMAYNAARQDHKHDTRAAIGGKRY